MIMTLKKVLKIISKILLIVMTFAFGIVILATTIMVENVDAVNSFLHVETQQILPDENAADKDHEYYKSAFTSVNEVRANGKVYAETIVAEGATLLKNGTVDGPPALPLAKNAGVSLFSTSSVSPVYNGTGSSGTNTDCVSLKTGLEEAGLRVNGDLYTWYEDNFDLYGRKKDGETIGVGWTIGDARWSEIDTDAKTDGSYGDAAIFVVSRNGGEGRDVTIYNGSKTDYTDGNYLKLSPSERDVLQNLKAQKDMGVFKRIIVLMNTANQVQCDFVDDPAFGVDALMWVGTLGEVGAYAVGDLLAGNVNPSGKLSDTFWKEHWLNPVNANYALLVDSSNSVTQDARTRNVSSGKHIVYQEGVYMGYRYTETRYEDTVLKDKDNVGNFVYGDVVSYPFGYGLSYTRFGYSDFKVEKTYKSAVNKLKDNIYTVSVKVTNEGEKAGKEAVQFYLQKPYTPYDVQHGIEKPAVELVSFGKTKLLKQNESDVVTAVISEREFATYDARGAQTYIVDAGTYYLTAGRDAHDAANNILAANGKTTDDGMTANGDAGLTRSFEMAFDDKTYATAAATGNAITNQFDNADLKIYDGAGDNANVFDYMTRSNWNDTVFYGLTRDNERTNVQVKITPTAKMQEDLTLSYADKIDPDDTPYPTYGSTKTSYTLVDLRAYDDEDDDPSNNEWLPYDDPMWEDLLDQLTWAQTVDLLSHGYRKTAALAAIAKPETIDHNGATGPVESYSVNSNADVSKSVNQGYAVRRNDPNKKLHPVVWPCNGLVASTFNLSLADYYGRQWGEDCLWAGYSGLYGMGMNTHRSAYGGRNFEYYSEDPVLMGKIAAASTRGLATRGVYVYLKHCFLNDQETYRCGGFTWANEQTIREIYMRSFQIAIEEGGAQCVMGGLNSIGMMWTGTQGFMNSVLRSEFGMTGHVVTDSYGWYNGSFYRSVYYGNDIPDGTAGGGFAYAAPDKGGYGNMAQAMRESVHRLLYTVVHSNAMNNFSAGTRIVKLTPYWIYMLDGFKIGFGILFGASVAFFGVMFWLNIEKKQKGVNINEKAA